MMDNPNEIVVLDAITFTLNDQAILKNLRVKPESAQAGQIQKLISQARQIGSPQAVYRPVYVGEKGHDFISLDGAKIYSRVMRVNLEQAYRVFFYVATSGKELEAWSRSFEDLLLRFYAESINEMVLELAEAELVLHLKKKFHVKNLSTMHPGSLEDWPLEGQKLLFDMLGDPEKTIGVHLTESLLMVPTKSVSGIFFPTEEDFTSCMLCPRQVCPGRRAPFDKELLETKYGR